VRYLFGDSSESDLEFDYLAFLREVVDCAVVMAECEVTLAATVEGRRSRELETASVVAAVEELGKRVSQHVGPTGNAPATTPVGRCAAAITAAIRDAVDRESSQARAALAVECEEMDRQDQRQRVRAKDVLEKLLRAHDLPGADRTLEVAWSPSGVKATMRQRTGFGVEAVVALDVPASSLFGLDLRVERIVEGVEIHAHETAGWLKKSDKVVAHKLGRYQVSGVLVGGDATTVRLRAAPEASAGGFVVTSHRGGDLRVEPTGAGPSREIAVDERDVARLRLLAERLETAVRGLADNRTGLVSLEIDGVPIAQYEHPRVFAERLITAVAPTVQNIAQRSRSPGELVLRRLLGDNRREEIFISTAELRKRLDGLPSHAREVFAPLQLDGEPARSAPDEPRPAARPTAEVKPASAAAPAPAPAERTVTPADRRFDTEPETRPDARNLASRAVPPPAPMPMAMAIPELRGGPGRLGPPVPAAEARRASRPTPPRGEPPVVDMPMFEDRSPPFATPRADPTLPGVPRPLPASETKPPTAAPRAADKPPEAAAETGRKRSDDSLGDAIDRLLDDSDDTPLPR
jgi:hypothetical protein